MSWIALIYDVYKQVTWYEKIVFILAVPITIIFFIVFLYEFIKKCILYVNSYIRKNCDDICNNLNTFTDNFYEKYYSEEERIACDNRKYRKQRYNY